MRTYKGFYVPTEAEDLFILNGGNVSLPTIMVEDIETRVKWDTGVSVENISSFESSEDILNAAVDVLAEQKAEMDAKYAEEQAEKKREEEAKKAEEIAKKEASEPASVPYNGSKSEGE